MEREGDQHPSARRWTWKNPWVIGWISAVAVVLGVNITMVVLAITTNPGLIRGDYYERGRDVERTIQTRLAEGPQWTIQIDTPADIRAETASRVRFAAVDQVGQPVRAEQVRYYVYRPSDAARDFSLPMTQVGPGLFEAQVTFPLGGIWDTLVSVRHGDEEHSFAERISVLHP
ncbi:FixH family protein [uncultured Thiohalocapsa sp.]|uniref:FixH family protein n=1 Tax=uncultured Thiohalocapsa sp. TaxID=768990 RepID=UPI0025DFF723|nr:FixH family protein [uncultured Thiohalocapsa sp.]